MIHLVRIGSASTSHILFGHKIHTKHMRNSEKIKSMSRRARITKNTVTIDVFVLPRNYYY
jgi:hypothetical protein